MRISDWSSDVCSSDLRGNAVARRGTAQDNLHWGSGMTLQDEVWIISLAGIGLIALGFVLVILQAGKPADDETTRKSARNARRLQAWLFGILLVGFVAGTWATLHRYPIPPQDKPLDAHQVVDVVGRQWSWQIKPSTIEAG